MLLKVGVFKSFAIFTGKYLCWSIFLLKMFEPLYWKETPTQKFCEILRIAFFIEYLWWLRLVLLFKTSTLASLELTKRNALSYGNVCWTKWLIFKGTLYLFILGTPVTIMILIPLNFILFLPTKVLS